MARRETPVQQTIREWLFQRTVNDLKPLPGLLGLSNAGIKEVLVGRLAEVLEDPRRVRELYESLDEVSRNAVREATHDPQGVLHRDRFEARYGHWPNWGGSGRREEGPTLLRLFFPYYETVLATDLRATLLAFVPPPEPLTVAGVEELPARVMRGDKAVELRVRLTARPAQVELKALLRLIDSGAVKVSDKTQRPGLAGMKAVLGVLVEGDFYDPAEAAAKDWHPAADLTIRPFAWPLILQAANLAVVAGGRLQLTPAGRKALTQPAHEVLRQAWQRWRKNSLLDEFNRIDVVKGQQSANALTAAAPRRQELVEALAVCPAGKWVPVERLWQFLRASGATLDVARNADKLYVGDSYYGSLSRLGSDGWDLIEGRYVLAVLFEYAATTGLLDVAYVHPESGHGTAGYYIMGDRSCVSRYDGLLFFRINALGAWCLGLAEGYEAEETVERPVLKVLPNLDVVVTAPPLGGADRLTLERFAEPTSDLVWRLGPAKVLAAVEAGSPVSELQEFLTARSGEPLPHAAEVFLADVAARAGQLEDLGEARVIRARDAEVAQLLVRDRRLRGLCRLAGDRELVFRAADEAAVRRGLRELGYVLPPAP